MKFVLVLFLISQAHAGWWGNWCERNLIAYDNEPYYTAGNAKLERMYREEGGKAFWSKESP